MGQLAQFAQLKPGKCQASRGNLTRGGANLARLTMTAQVYRQDALTRPNLTQCGPNLPQIYVILQRQQEKESVTSGSAPPAGDDYLAATAVSRRFVSGQVHIGSA